MTEEGKKKIRRLADEFGQGCHRLGYHIADLFGECERRGYCVVRYPLATRAVKGFAQIREGDRILYSNSALPFAQERFALAMALGHILMHMEETERWVDDDGSLDGEGQEKRQEARFFAQCLLMPESEVYRYLHLVMEGRKLAVWNSFDIARMQAAFQMDFDQLTEGLQGLGWLKKNEAVLFNEKRREETGRLLNILGNGNSLNRCTMEKKIPEKYMEWVLSNYHQGMIRENTLERVLGYFGARMEDIDRRDGI